ncbi:MULTISPECIES: MarR family winged helix-turn-helix transcriptional regulator [Bacillus]|uniref:Winged helix-turn-helix transcriptional regulator n=1 Tax=Bacillus mycoides TaxID=1405 RepID=A0ABX6ZDX8_BACMY|nr:MarR family winged helix-turn-helix transcriptional regulator [Bacillus mycoides]AJH18606.1 iclR helix-turn-helix domain protein [Bacillus mycoides]EEL99148.1 transcriptional regulator [Bacillus mycoides DSM 2048]MDR4238207.1 winged helix-turn-helix transcriptional regulator [Bacillus mycoides]MED1427324.1 MarR family winged helix-turn-helix transcriptional regulator [Bacillus mycoides]MED1484780.1 MarR family winged helix-turn-helix transcriptional regulator [Bacillus mycoides]
MILHKQGIKQASEIVHSFVKINKEIIKFTHQNASTLGLTVQQMGILNSIYATPNTTLKDISERLSVPKSTMSVNVDELVNLGLIERKQSHEDRREIQLKVTTKGQEISKRSIENSTSYKAMELALEQLSEEDIQILLRIHNDLLNSLQHFK